MVGAPGLEKLLRGVFPGDNCVWRIDRETIPDFLPFAEALITFAVDHGKRAIYFRFGSHQPLSEARDGLEIHHLNPEGGFENFITEIHRIIRSRGKGAYYLFDSLSELSEACYSDRMIGNFFVLTCPFLREFETIAYFLMYRYVHSYHAATPIAETVQVLIDLYSHGGVYYLRPFKVEGRSSSTMYMLHEWSGEEWVPIPESGRVAEVIHASPWPGLPSTSYRMIGVWDKVFINAEHVQEEIEGGRSTSERERTTLHQILRLIVSQDQRIFELAAKYFTIKDVLAIWKRMIGTGMIGGKSVGMLLARSILLKEDPQRSKILEDHDSFFIGSDVFYTYLVINNCWWARQRQKDPSSFLDGNEDVRRRILAGDFPDYILHRFSDMLDYFGYSPIIVRSSSLLEDNFGNAFAGKYESVFCPNQGTKDQRMKNFLDAVRVIYASTMSDGALRYRKQRGVLDKDEQMALLVQRVSGVGYGRYYLPQLAGVGFSINPYVWNSEIDPNAGMLRLVFGLGTHAVERSDDDYTRVVALNAPEKRPEASLDEVRRYAQRKVDLLDLVDNKFTTLPISTLVEELGDRLPFDYFVSFETATEPARRSPKRSSPLLTFDRVFKATDFISSMRGILSTICGAYGVHVDIEFTASFMPNGEYRINVVQCRPFQAQLEEQPSVELPRLDIDDIVMDARGAVIGPSRVERIDWILYVDGKRYSMLTERDRYSVARLIGRVLHQKEVVGRTVMLVGPGRWGTSSPSLGIPVSFSEIDTASILCEINVMHEGLNPDLSLGTHFFNELVEMNMLYVAYFAQKRENLFRENWLLEAANELDAEPFASVATGSTKAAGVVHLINTTTEALGRKLVLNADSVGQRAVLHLQ